MEEEADKEFDILTIDPSLFEKLIEESQELAKTTEEVKEVKDEEKSHKPQEEVEF
jgi:hypothetical protein